MVKNRRICAVLRTHTASRMIERVRVVTAYRIASAGRFWLWVSDEAYLKVLYWLLLGERLNLDRPRTFTEKLQFLKVNDRRTLYHQLVDKYDVREYVENRIGRDYLVPLLGVYDSVDDIDWDALPRHFVLKASHTSGDVIICHDKDSLDVEQTRRRLQRWLGRNYFAQFREWPYRGLKPRIIAEVLLSESGRVPVDFKILCFEGSPYLIQVHEGRFESHRISYFDVGWKQLNVWTVGYPFHGHAVERPARLDEMLSIASALSQELPQCRIDLYFTSDRIYFGEITFFDGAGFDKFLPAWFDRQLGGLIDLNRA